MDYGLKIMDYGGTEQKVGEYPNLA